MTDNTPAWAFVLRHSEMMERLSYRFAGALSESDRAEWMQDVVLRLVERFPSYDPDRSAPVTWIVWQMRAVTTTWTRRFQRQLRERATPDEHLVLIPLDGSSYGSEEHSLARERYEDAVAIVETLYSEASEEERIAIRTTLAGLSATDLRKRYRMTGRQRNSHLRALRARIPGDDR
jgi:RNA polymerase sigma factor (sigma-70 family)